MKFFTSKIKNKLISKFNDEAEYKQKMASSNSLNISNLIYQISKQKK